MMITIHNLVKSYGGHVVVNVPSVTIQTGEIIGLVGNNGAGKTTLFRLILDLVRADKGEVLIKDEKVANSENWKQLTAAYLDENFLIGYLTPEEYFYFIGKLNNLSRTDVDEFLKSFAAFFDGNILQSGKYIRDLSKGNQFKTGIAACLLQHPELLILDEPFANLDPTSQVRLIRLLQEEQSRNRTTILISSHDLSHISDVCTRVLLMEKGDIIKDIPGSPEMLKELEAYFHV